MCANRELQNEKFLPTVGFEPGPSAYEANSLSVELLKLINIDLLKVTAFYLNVLLIVTYTAKSATYVYHT